MTALDGEPHGRRTEMLEVFGDEFMNALGRLVGDEAESEFGAGPGGDDGLAAFALVTAGEAVDLDGRARDALFLRRITALAEKFGDSQKLPVSRVVVRNPRQLFSLVSGERNNVFVEAGDGDASVLVAQSREQLAQSHRWIVHRTAVNARVQITGRTVHFDFERGDATQRVGQRRMLQVRYARIGNDDGVAAQLRAVFFQENREILAADLLFSFDDEGEVARQVGLGFQVGFHRLEMGKVLAFVVAGAAGEERMVFDAGLEGRRFPQVQRLGRLNVVVAVNQEMWAPTRGGGGAGRCLRDDDRIAVRRAEPNVQADGPAMVEQPAGGGFDVRAMVALR